MQADPAVVLDLIEAFRRSKTMFAAVELGLFDRLPATAAELGQPSEPLERLLNACAGLGLVEKRGGVFSNAPVAQRYLTSASPDTLTGYILYSNRALYPMWGRLEDAVKEGSHRWTQAFGFEGPLFDHFFRTAEARRNFLQGMHGLGRLSSPQVVRVFNLSGFEHLVDLGGGTGHLAAAACARYANMRATLYDLPQVIELAREFLEGTRVETQAGDFFRDGLPPADLYAIGRILHDWSEPKIERLLTRIHAALPPGGGLLIAERLLDDDALGPVPAQMQSLNMLVCAEGRERTVAEYTALLAAAGFHSIEARRTGAPLDALLARRK